LGIEISSVVEDQAFEAIATVDDVHDALASGRVHVEPHVGARVDIA
jgi:hypothetical protein